MTGIIKLTLSPQRRLTSVATLVAGGVGGRLELPVDRIDDLQLAITTLLGRVEDDAEVTLEFEPDGSGVTCRVGPFGESVGAVLPTVARLVTHASSDAQHGAVWVTLRLDARRAHPPNGDAG
jgi:hypothetical protein